MGWSNVLEMWSMHLLTDVKTIETVFAMLATDVETIETVFATLATDVETIETAAVNLTIVPTETIFKIVRPVS